MDENKKYDEMIMNNLTAIANSEDINEAHKLASEAIEWAKADAATEENAAPAPDKAAGFKGKLMSVMSKGEKIQEETPEE